MLYAPAAAVGLSGNAQVTGTLVVSTLSVSGNAGAFQLADGASSSYAASTSNWITNGVLTVAVQDDTGNGIDPSERNQIGEAMAYLNQALGSFGVNLSWAAPGTNADVHIHFAATTPQGGAGDGVLAFTTASDDVYFATGWQLYTGDDASQILPNQYDFLTLATHELAHTVGLGESSDPTSVLDEYLAPGTVRRTISNGDLAAINTTSDRFVNVGAGDLDPGRLSRTASTANGASLSSPTGAHPALIVGFAAGSSQTLSTAAPVVVGAVSARTESPESPFVLSPRGPLALGSERLFTRRLTTRPSGELPHSPVRSQAAANPFGQAPFRIDLPGQTPSSVASPTGQSIDDTFIDADQGPSLKDSGPANLARHDSALDLSRGKRAFEDAWVDQIVSGIVTQAATTPRRTRPADRAAD